MTKLKFLFFPTILALAFSLMLSCAKSSSDDSSSSADTSSSEATNTSSAITVSGKVQKGPYVQGTEITVRELDSSMTPTGNTFTGPIDDNTGSFSIKGTLTNKIVELSALGYYFNEVSGSLSNATLTLSALSDLTDSSSVNVNLMTHLEKKRVEYLIDAGLTFAAAKTQAQTEILKIFNIENVTLGNSETLDISKSGDGNAVLLAISALLQSNKSEAELTELLSMINTDIRTDGTLDGSNTKQILVTAMEYLKPIRSTIRSNIESRYSYLGISANIPAFESYAFKLDTTAPTIASTSYSYGSKTFVSVVHVAFSKFLDNSSLSSSTFYLKNSSGDLVYGVITSVDNSTSTTASFTPSVDMSLSDNYTATLTTSVKDLAGNGLATDQTWNFINNITAPVIAEATAVTTPTNDTTPAYTFSSTEAGTITYGGNCTSSTTSATSGNNAISFSTLSEGSYSCTITVTDSAGNASTALTVSSFTIDTTAPSVDNFTLSDTALKAGDNATVTLVFSEAVVSFSSGDDITVANGSLANMSSADNVTWAGTFTPTANTEDASNTLSLATSYTDTAGNAGPTVTTANYAVDTLLPTLAETTAVSTFTNDNSTQYTFSSSEGGTISVGGSCRSDNNTAVADNMTMSFAALADGTYSDCTITVTDSAGNTQTISVNTFTIDTVKPVLALVTAVTTPTNDNTSSYTFSSTETGSITYGVCNGSPNNAVKDNNTITFDALADGAYSDCKISVTDNASNTSDNLSVSSFTIDTVKPVLAQVTAVTTPTKDPTPGYAFSSNEAGTISYSGCSPGGTSAINGTNSISFGTLNDASYSSCTITVTDSAGNASSALSVNTFVVDTTAPTVSSISSSTSDGAYKINDNITVTVTFNDNVIVDNSSGNPRIQLETGTNDRYANYISGNSTSVLSFLYSVQSGDNSSDLDYKATDSLSANSGTIRDNATNDSILTLSSPGESGSIGANKDIVIDGIVPTVSSTSPSDGATTGVPSISATFSEVMDNSTLTTSTFTLTDNSSNSVSGTVSSSDNTTVTFTSSSITKGSYTATVSNAVKDAAGNSLVQNYSWSFEIKWVGTKQLGTSSAEEAYGVATDSSGNVYVTGYTEGGLDGNTNAGSKDLFVVKYNSIGTKQWTKQLGTSSIDEARGVATDSSGNVYVAGFTGGGLDNNTSAGNYDLFVVKYNSSGTKQWTKQLGTSSVDKANGVATDSSGNVYVTGWTKGGLDGNTNSGDDDLFLVKYNSSGTKQWTKLLGTSMGEVGEGVTVDSSDNIYITGSTGGDLDNNTNSGGNDLFLVKYNSSGTKQWTKQLGSSGSDLPMAVTVDNSSNIYVTGETYGGFDGYINGTPATGYGTDIFLVKFNSSGTKQWTKQLSTSVEINCFNSCGFTDSGQGVTVDSSNNIYVAGYTYGGLDGNTSSGVVDIFLVKYLDNGTKVWTEQLGTYEDDMGLGVTVDNSSNIYVTGFTKGVLDGNTNAGNRDIFVVKYNDNGTKQ